MYFCMCVCSRLVAQDVCWWLALSASHKRTCVLTVSTRRIDPWCADLGEIHTDSCAAALDWLLISVITKGLCSYVVCVSVVASKKLDGMQRASGREPTESEIRLAQQVIHAHWTHAGFWSWCGLLIGTIIMTFSLFSLQLKRTLHVFAFSIFTYQTLRTF